MEEKKFLSESEQETKETKKPKKSGVFWVFLIISVILISSAFGAIFGFISASVSQKLIPVVWQKFSGEKQETKSKEVVRQQVIEEDSAIIDVVEKTTPAVVSIVVTKDIPKVRDFFLNPFDYEDFSNPFQNPLDQQRNGNGGTEKQKIGGGSGFIISSDGMIITNKHVVEDPAAEYTIITNDGKEHEAKVLARDSVNDIAIVKIENGGYATLSLGDSDNVKIGQTVIAIGNSLGEFSNTVSKGIVSGLKRSVTASGGFGATEKLSNIIQTDAAINPGNSGGPLLNINGEVIGINVAMAQGAENIGFAIPVNQIKKTIDQVKSTGRIIMPYLGVRYIPIDESIQKENNLPYGYGALVLRGERMTDFAVIPGSPADKAGIVENDIILEINGTKVDKNNGLADLISRYDVGDEISLKVWHKGDLKEVRVKLEERK